jgi:hypothetical protein
MNGAVAASSCWTAWKCTYSSNPSLILYTTGYVAGTLPLNPANTPQNYVYIDNSCNCGAPFNVPVLIFLTNYDLVNHTTDYFSLDSDCGLKPGGSFGSLTNPACP